MICLAGTGALLLVAGAGALVATPNEQAYAEAQLARHVRVAYERAGRTAPAMDEALTRAASALATDALARSPSEAGELSSVMNTVSAAGLSDPAPRALIVRASPAKEVLSSVAKRADLASEPATHFGVAMRHARGGGRGVAVLVLVDRKATVAPFPRSLPAPGERRLCVTLDDSLREPVLYVSRPAGEIDRQPLRTDGAGPACAGVKLAARGRHAIEVMARGRGGPEVVALFFVDVGRVDPSEPSASPQPEPANEADARAALIARINALRSAHRLGPVEWDDALARIAQAYATRMARHHFFAHVAPEGDTLFDRLQRAGYAYRLAGENLGLADGPLAAQRAIEQSPGHRQNLLGPEYTRLGLGFARRTFGDEEQVIVTQLLAAPAKSSADPLRQAYGAADARREAIGLRKLSRSPALERLAHESVAETLRGGQPLDRSAKERLYERIFKTLPDVSAVAVDFFVSQSSDEVAVSKNLAEGEYDLIGVGIARGSSTRFGEDKLWMLVIYAGKD